ncbi:MAG: IS4 family transposase [Lentisphaeria bacterium]
MARTKAVLESKIRVTDCISLGVLTRFIPRGTIDEALLATGTESQRERLLPAHVVVYYVLALALFMNVETREVLRWLFEGLKWLTGGAGIRVAGKSGISQARTRLGWRPMQAVYDRVVRPVAGPASKGACYMKWKLASIDGSVFDVADTKENAAAFKRPKASRGRSALPQIRAVALVENGTHVLFGARMAGCRISEAVLAREVLHALKPGMLCLADRYYPSFSLWGQASATGADLLWRVPRHWKLTCIERLSDGSCISELYASTSDRAKRRNGVRVRVIEYQLTGTGKEHETYRLITTILKPDRAPASELAALYHERWEIEMALDELKTHLRGNKVVLRSKSPDLVRQEFYGLMLTHFAIRALMFEAATKEDVDPDRLSFMHTVRVVRHKLPRFAAALSPSGLAHVAL